MTQDEQERDQGGWWIGQSLPVRMRRSAKENSVFSHLRQELLIEAADALSLSEKRAEELERPAWRMLWRV